MKNLKMLFWTIILIVGSSCGDSCLELLQVIIEDDMLTAGEKLELEITATDCDGIESITIQIPILGIDEVIENPSGNEKMKIEREFLTGEANYNGTYEVKVIVKDNEGEEKVDLSDITFD